MIRTAVVTFATAAAVLIANAPVSYASDTVQAQVKANFVEADTDNDATLTPSEFVTFINLNADYGIGRSRTIRSFGRYDMAFSRVDANRDGAVTPEELKSATK